MASSRSIERHLEEKRCHSNWVTEEIIKKEKISSSSAQGWDPHCATAEHQGGY